MQCCIDQTWSSARRDALHLPSSVSCEADVIARLGNTKHARRNAEHNGNSACTILIVFVSRVVFLSRRPSISIHGGTRSYAVPVILISSDRNARSTHASNELGQMYMPGRSRRSTYGPGSGNETPTYGMRVQEERNGRIKNRKQCLSKPVTTAHRQCNSVTVLWRRGERCRHIHSLASPATVAVGEPQPWHGQRICLDCSEVEPLWQCHSIYAFVSTS